jgi:hypothetical protein
MSPAPGATVRAFVVAAMMIEPVRAGGVAAAQAPVLTRNALRADALGCFVLLDSRRQSVAGLLRRAPARVRLDSARDRPSTFPNATTTLWRIEYRDSTNRVVGVTPATGLASSWSADSLTDSIRIRFSDGFTGSGFVFALPSATRSDALFGRAYTFVDAGPPYRTDRGPAFAVRYSCAQ